MGFGNVASELTGALIVFGAELTLEAYLSNVVDLSLQVFLLCYHFPALRYLG
jgi:hypothetical protein